MYIGKVAKSMLVKEVENDIILRHFLVRRIRSLEVMFTNGLNHWCEFVQGSDIMAPFTISNVKLVSEGTVLIVNYSHLGLGGGDSQSIVRTFQMNNRFNFDSFDHPSIAMRKNIKNIFMSEEGDFFEINIKVTKNRKITGESMKDRVMLEEV